VGLVVHEEQHGHACISSHEHVMCFLREREPHLAGLLDGRVPRDFLCLRKYSHTVSRAWSADRWAMVGEASAFVDPLYSPGSDFIALANAFTVGLLREALAGGDVVAKAAQLNGHYRALVIGTVDLFRHAASVYGHPSAMATKVFWDNFSYWSFTCQFSRQELWALSSEAYEPFGALGRRFLSLGSGVQRLLQAWAQLAPEPQRAVFIGAPRFPSVLIDAHARVGQSIEHGELLPYMRTRLAQAEEMAGEIALRTARRLGPELGREALARADFAAWGIAIPSERLETERLVGLARRKRLSAIARDVELTLGAVAAHARADEALELLVCANPAP
jgi:hypothetical protein